MYCVCKKQTKNKQKQTKNKKNKKKQKKNKKKQKKQKKNKKKQKKTLNPLSIFKNDIFEILTGSKSINLKNIRVKNWGGGVSI